MFKKLFSLIVLTFSSFQIHAEFRDPTQPDYPTHVEAAIANIEEQPRLSAIWITSKARWATFNGIQAKQGQSISANIKIIKISKNAVTINQNGIIKTLQLLQRPYKSQ